MRWPFFSSVRSRALRRFTDLSLIRNPSVRARFVSKDRTKERRKVFQSVFSESLVLMRKLREFLIRKRRRERREAHSAILKTAVRRRTNDSHETRARDEQSRNDRMIVFDLSVVSALAFRLLRS